LYTGDIERRQAEQNWSELLDQLFSIFGLPQFRHVTLRETVVFGTGDKTVVELLELYLGKYRFVDCGRLETAPPEVEYLIRSSHLGQIRLYFGS
jgi:hypothetical protein